MFAKLKLKITSSIRRLIFSKFNHYSWPRRLHSRMFDFNEYYDFTNAPFKHVNLGAGPYFVRKGWVSADFLPDFKTNNSLVHIDLVKDPDNLPFKDLKCIYASHLIEHMHYGIGTRVLRAAYNSLDLGGYIRICVPDADLLINKVRENDFEYFRPVFSYYDNKGLKDYDIYDICMHLIAQSWSKYTIHQGSTEYILNKNDRTDDFKNMLNNGNTNDEIISFLNNHSNPQDEAGSIHMCAYNSKLMINTLKEAGFKDPYNSEFMKSNYGPLREVPIFDGTHPWMTLYTEAVKI